jgi:hypothetical protein
MGVTATCSQQRPIGKCASVYIASYRSHAHQGTQMKTMRLLPAVVSITCLVASSVSFAVTAEEHASHHPDLVAAAASASKSTAASKAKAAAPAKAASSVGMQMSADMDKQMQAMRDMHDKMMNAKTQEERRALMGDQMKTMQDGMSMMSQMSKDCMGKGDMMSDMHKHHEAMMKRMDMMQMMMQMMMDRASAETAK